MVSKAKAFNDLVINAKEGLDVCIWKLMADRVGRTKSEIGDELLPHGFNRKQVENRAETLMRTGKWFERDEIKSRGITKYILKRECRMPTIEPALVPSQEPVLEERGKHRRQKSVLKSAMQEALEKAVKNNEQQQQQTELPINPDAGLEGDQLNILPEGINLNRNPSLNRNTVDIKVIPLTKPEAPAKTHPTLDLANGLSTTIWDAMCDFDEYTKEDVMVLLEAVGANPATARIRLQDLEKEGWFTVRLSTVPGKKPIKHYRLNGVILRPEGEKPYRASPRKQGEPVKAENKQDNVAGTTQNEDQILAQAVWDTIIDTPNESTGVLMEIVADKTGISALRAKGMIMDMAPKYLTNNGTKDHPKWFIAEGTPLPEEFGGEAKPYQRVFNDDEIEKATEIIQGGLAQNAPYRLGTLRNYFENGFQCSMSDSEVEILVNVMIEKNVMIYVGSEIDPMYMLSPYKVKAEVNATLMPNPDVSEDGIANALTEGSWVYLGQEAIEKITTALTTLLQDGKEYSEAGINHCIRESLGVDTNLGAVKQLMVQNGVMDVVNFGEARCFTKPQPKDDIEALADLDKDKLEQFVKGPVAAPEVGQELLFKNRGEVTAPKAFVDNGRPAHMQVTDLELDLWQKLALANGQHPFNSIRLALNELGYDDAEINEVFEEDKKYFLEAEGGIFVLPVYMTTSTITKEKIIDFKKRADRLAGRIEQGQQAQIQQALEQAGAQETFTSGDVKDALEELSARPTLQSLHGLSASSIARGTGYSIAGSLTGKTKGEQMAQRALEQQASARDLDHALWRIFADRDPHLMSDVVAQLRTQGFSDSAVRDRIMVLVGNNFKILNTVPHAVGMAFQMATGVNPVLEGEEFVPNNYVDTIIAAEGFIRSVWRLLSNGRARTMDELVHRLEPHFMADWSKKLLNRMFNEGVLDLAGPDGKKLKLADDFHLPPLPVNPTSLNVNEGIDRNLWLLCADRNWHDVKQLTSNLSVIGYRPDRVLDHVAKQMDLNGFLERDIFSTDYGRTEIVRLKQGATVPEREIPAPEDRRQSHSGGFHSYVGGEAAPKEEAVPMFEITIKVLGQDITLPQLFQLATELRGQGIGVSAWGRPMQFNKNTGWGESSLLQTTHTLFGKEITNEQLELLAKEIYRQLPVSAPVGNGGGRY